MNSWFSIYMIDREINIIINVFIHLYMQVYKYLHRFLSSDH